MGKCKAFFTAFAVTMCILGLGVGLFTVGYNSRKVAQGDAAPTASYKLQNGQLTLTDASGASVTLAVTEEKETTAPLIPAPARVGGQLLRGIAVLAEKLAERLG